MATRKEVKAVLTELGFDNKFQLRQVGFDHGTGQFCIIKDWKPTPTTQEVRARLKSLGVILDVPMICAVD